LFVVTFLCGQKAQRKIAQQVARPKERAATGALPRAPPSPFLEKVAWITKNFWKMFVPT
jgi:hypothetical protein